MSRGRKKDLRPNPDEGHKDAPTASPLDTQERAHSRLEDLFEISKLFATFASVNETFGPALTVVARTLPLRSAILIDEDNGEYRTFIWPLEGQNTEQMQTVRKHAEATYRYLVGSVAPTASPTVNKGAEPERPRPTMPGGDLAKRLIAIPLVVAHRPLFGILQTEGTQPFDKGDLTFVNTIANQLAVALDRDRAWRLDIARRDNAEQGRTQAETRGSMADRQRIIAEGLSEKFEALAEENARLYEEARQAVRARERILSIVSHDLRNPLSAVLVTARILAKGRPPEAGGGLAGAVARIQRSAERMQRLIEDLLDFASIENHQLAIRRAPHDAGVLLHEALASFEGVANEKRLRLTAEIAPALPLVNGDHDRILQVLSNLGGNATKIAPEGGQVTLRVEARGQDLLFVVSDNGPGIGEEDLKHIFEPYWRSAEAQYKGTGLGLAIARGIVDAHGGRIWAESVPGQGATFFFTVPNSDPARPRPNVPAEASSPPLLH